MKNVLRYLSALLICASFGIDAWAKTFYVTPTGSNPTTVENAWVGKTDDEILNLQEALTQAKAGDEIWMLGFSQITSKDQLYIAPVGGFVLPSGVKLYGGFEGTETNIIQRKNQGKPYQMSYRSVLSGDINRDDKVDPVNTIFPENTTRSDNAKHVLVMNAYRNSSDNLNDNSNPTVVNGVTIIGGNGAETTDVGGGIYVKGNAGDESVPYSISCCYLLNNYAYKGGAIYVDDAVTDANNQSLINQCVVYNNVAGTVIGKENLGGGIYMAGAGNIVNTSVFNNENGGVVLSASAYLVNSTVSRNTGGGVDMDSENISGIHVYNSVVWGNSHVSADSNRMPQFDHSAYPEATGENNNIVLSTNNRGDANSPMFDAPSLKTSFDQEYNWRRSAYPTWSWKLVEGSCLIDQGNSDAYKSYSNNFNQDLGGDTRIVGTAVDISSYEFQAIPAARIRYVKTADNGGSDSHNGTSWDQAYASVQKAIDDLATQPGVPGEVWIAGGTYEPTALINGSGTPASFRMHDGISVYGGFAGTESSKSDRTKSGSMPWLFTNETKLSGSTYNGENKWNSTDNKWSLTSASTHVVWFAPLPGGESFKNITVLDGVTIQGGQAKTSEADNYEGDKGAGVYMLGVNVYLTNSIVKDNVAPSDGGGIYLKNGRVQGCLVYNNSSESRGGGVYVDNAGLVLRSMVTNNSSQTGGGVFLDNNGVQADGQEHPEYLILSTSVVSNNTSVKNGAVYCNKGGVILQSTITNNYTPTATDAASSSAAQTGGLYIDTYAQVFNSVLWNNYIKDQNVQLYAQNASAENVSFYYSALSGMNNIIWNNTLQKELISLADANISSEGMVAPDFSSGYPTEKGVNASLSEVTYFWEPREGSNLRARGMSLGQLPSSVLLAPELDIAGDLFAQKPAIGAFSIQATNIVPEETDNSLVIYVDVEATNPDNNGSSWKMPYRSLNEAIAYMAGLSKDYVGSRTLEIRVAEGDIWPRYAYVNQDAKSATIEVLPMQSGSTLYIKGGYSYSADGSSTRAPLTYRSQINGNHEGKTQAEGLYHCITVEQNANVEFDGFHIINGYAASTANLKYGAGMLVRAGATVTVKNSIFENNTAFEGAAIDAREASLNLINCVVNNNTNETNTASVINCPNLTLNHVSVVNNIGAAPSVMGASSFAAGNTSGDTHDIVMTTANFVNPTKDPGAILGFDTYLGGYSSFMPTNQCVVVNQVTSPVSGLSEDITGGDRSRGGAPDLGAYEAELPVDGTVIYVRASDGNNENGGLTWGTAKKTITAALNAVTSDTEAIWVAAGTYNEHITLKEGVDLLGGFAAVGNPDNKLDDKNRNISNTTEGFMTTIDGQSGDRVVTQSGNFNTLTTIEGFIIQNGRTSGSNGGAGVLLKNNGKIKNCLIQKNVYNMTSWNTNEELGGGGVRIEGSGIIESSIVRNNTVSSEGRRSYVCGGGLYLKADNSNTPKLINCVVAENEAINKRDASGLDVPNRAPVLGAAVYLSGNGANIYNCTFAYNKADAVGYYTGWPNYSVKEAAAGGVWDASYSYANSATTGSSFYNCIFWGNYGIGSTQESTYQVGTSGFDDGQGFNPKVYNCYISATTENQVTSGSLNLWNNAEQCYALGQYGSAEDGTEFKNTCFNNAPFDNTTFMLNNSGTGLYCINKGNNDYVADIDLDAAGATRIQFCTVDKGAYESTDAITIKPDGNGVYYVTETGKGTSNGSSVANAACAMELQSVLYAAGDRAKEGQPAIVKIATSSDGNFVYHANTLSDPNDPQSYTFVIPYGVTVLGGYKDTDTDWSDANRKPKENRTILSAICNSSSLEQEVNGYHTVTFGAKPEGWTGADKQTIIDGLYLINGKATSMAGEGNPNTRGGGAIVPAWAHVRNCVVDSCEAVQGGGLYLMPGATVSGTVLKNNTAEDGGAIYADNENAGEDSRAHVVSCTITDNTATSEGGGIYLEEGAMMAINTVVWNNTAPSDKNISGIVSAQFPDKIWNQFLGESASSSETASFFPFNYSFVETYELPSDFENTTMEAEDSYFANDDRVLRTYSPLIKHGMTDAIQKTLESALGISDKDMQNIGRAQNLGRVDAGAYAFEGGEMPASQLVTRIFVSQAANVQIPESEMDQYIGRSFYTSLTWLDDALAYIRKVRSNGLATDETKFEILVAGGVYTPSYQRSRQTGEAPSLDQRMNTFELPVGVSIYGGFSGKELYSSAAASENPIEKIPGVEGEFDCNGDIETILGKRTYSDLNSNGILESYELENQTILSGDINVSPFVKNAYHVVYSSGSGSVLLDGVTIKDGETWNKALEKNEIGRGGALYTNGVNYTLKGCRVMNSKAACGGAIYARDANLTIIGSVLAGNGTIDGATSAGEEIRGGAVYMAGDTKPVALKSINTLWVNNGTTGTRKGGAIATGDANVTVSLMNNTIVRNQATEASAVYATAGDITNTVMWGGEGNGVVSVGLTVKNSASDGSLAGENNISLNASNMAVDGPRFALPSTAAGMAANDIASKWNPASISVLTDAGDGELEYSITDMAQATGAYKDWVTTNMADDPTFYMGDADYGRYMGPKPLKDQTTAQLKKIDIGLYEYQYKSEFLKMDEIYVDTQERGDGSGDSWDNATSDIRGAIVALSDPEGGSKSDKNIYIRGGEYPQAQLYVNDIAYQAVLNGSNEALTSLTIRGSYAENGQQDFSQPTILLPMPNSTKPVQTMFYANTNGKKLTLEGITFQNAQTTGFDADNSGTLNLKNVAFRQNGMGANIEGSGATLIANALFADGATGLSTTRGNRVTVVNATFAKNTAAAVSGAPAVYNSVSWKNGENGSSGLAEGTDLYNVNLGTAENDNLQEGPNFVDPDNGNYMLRPSIKLLNAASKEKYNELLAAAAISTKEGALVTAETDKDLGSNARLTDNVLDVGAYEYDAPLQQIVYVKSNVAQTDGTGSSWQNPIKDLQSAIDLASVYANKNSGANGYVFVHRAVNVSGIRVNMPNVKVYGGMNDEAGTNAQDLIDARSSVLANTMSTVSGLTVNGNGSVLDGFKIQGTVNVTNGVLSTSVIENATVGTGGIVYNSFVSGDLAGSGKAVNVTSPNTISVQTQENVVAQAPENGYVSDDIWKYQLKENDLGINNRNAVDVSQYMTMVGHERDLSGLPRVRDLVDAGCFESWTMTANTANKELTADAMPTGKHVVYVDPGVEISLASDLYPEGTNFNLGFLLLKHGAGFRSNGNAVSLTNLAVERDLDEANNRWDLAYVPFEVTRVAVDGKAVNSQEDLNSVSVKTYDGARRAEYDYQFSATDGAWEDVTGGWGGKGLLLQSADEADHTVRMYGNQYVELATEPSATVRLNKYNNMEPWSSASDNTSKRFTHLENMSWNMFGSPFLCAMNYGDMEYGRVIYKKSGDTFISENTTEVTEGSVPAGSAVLTQSATLLTQETFSVAKRKDAVQDGTGRGARLMVALAPQGQGEQDALALTAVPTEEASSEFNMAADGVKMMTVGRAAQIYMERAGNQYSLLSALDRNGKVDVSVYAPEAGTYSIFIPEDSPVDEYETVVLKDKVTGRAVDLFEGAYSFPMSEPGTLSSRFTLSFNREMSEDGLNRITFRTLGNGQVRISGLESGDRITAYQENGVMVYRGSADSAVEKTISLPGKISLIQVQSAEGRETIKKLVIR